MQDLQIIDIKKKSNNKKNLVWNEKCVSEKNLLDIFSLIDKNRHNIRKKYLLWIYQIQNLKIKEKNIIKHLKIDENFSFWWMLPISEKSNFMKSFQINEILKLIALEEYINKNKFKKIYSHGLNKKTNEVISFIAKKNKILFFSEDEKKTISFNFAIINFFKALSWLLIYLYKRRFLFGLNVSNWNKSKNKLCIVNYLFDLNFNLLDKKKMSSGYWSHLIDKIHSKNIGINWLNIYFENEEIYHSKKAKSIIRKLNGVNSNDVHLTLDSFLNLKIIILSLTTWLKIFYKSFILNKKIIIKSYKKNNFFVILSDEFSNNLQNHHSLKNILTYFLMNEAFKKISKQNTCIFPNENQQWEMALLKNYFINNHKNIIGYQHSTSRFWDLRTYYSKENYKKGNILTSYPRPNKLAIHSKIFYKILKECGYPIKNLKLVETLKYTKLINKNLKKNINTIPIPNKNKIIITLVLGAFQNFDKALVDCLQNNINNFDKNYSFFLKDQLSSDKVLEINETDRFKKINGDLLDVYRVSDLVLISNPSSAVLDAMYMKVPFYVYDGQDFLNFSPMYSIIDKKYFIRDYNFVSKIKSFKKNSSKELWNFNKKNILNGNNNVKEWEKIIKY